MMQVYLALGSNLGDREMNLVEAKDLLMKHDVLVVGQSEVRETEPLGRLDQPMYLNQVVECQTELSPEELLVVCKAVEKEMGRDVDMPGVGNVQFAVQRDEGDWKSRVIDVDILFYGDKVMDSSVLTIPHRGIAERNFVVDGMCDLAPNFVHPVLNKRMIEL